MTINRTVRTLAAVGVLALVPAGLAACSGGQSVEEACSVAQDNMTEAMGDMSELSSMMSSQDVDGITALLGDINDALDKSADEITNEEVSAAFGKFHTEYSSLTTAITEAAEDPMNADVESLTNAQSSITEASADLTELCG